MRGHVGFVFLCRKAGAQRLSGTQAHKVNTKPPRLTAISGAVLLRYSTAPADDTGQMYAPMEAGEDGGLDELPPCFVHVDTDRKKAEAALEQVQRPSNARLASPLRREKGNLAFMLTCLGGPAYGLHVTSRRGVLKHVEITLLPVTAKQTKY